MKVYFICIKVAYNALKNTLRKGLAQLSSTDEDQILEIVGICKELATRI